MPLQAIAPVYPVKPGGAPVTVTVPEPNTWREVLQALVGRSEKLVALQEYGRPNVDLLAGLAAQNRQTTSVPVYQWALPEDTAPLKEALAQLLAGQFRVALFTTGVQIDHFLECAELQGKRAEAVRALSEIFIASIGPTCSEALHSQRLKPAIEPSHPKMGLLVREAALAFAQ